MGKGSKRRNENFKAVQNNWSEINWDKKPEQKVDIKTHCPDCGHHWDEHDFGVPSPYCPVALN